MIWVILIESIVILIMGWVIFDTRRALNTMHDLWLAEKNSQWLEMMEESGAEVIRIDQED
jgi:hypothetical protein